MIKLIEKPFNWNLSKNELKFCKLCREEAWTGPGEINKKQSPPRS